MKIATSPFVLALVWGAVCSTASAAAAPEKEPGDKSKGKVHEWTSGGLRYQYYIPRHYDPAAGAPLTVILHGSNLDRRWGFANHKAGEFRPNDIVVSPDGTTSNGKGGFNSLGRPQDAKKFTDFLNGLRDSLKITDIYLYGHSQGSFFALYYAGAEPDAIAGVVAHASGVWTQTRQSAEGHGQAIVLMHGTADPVVPYSQSVGGYRSYVEKGYPMVRLRSLEGWNHWPAEHNGPIPHTSQQLAWVEGMTATDTKRLGAAFATLSKPKVKTQHDFQALYQVSIRLSKLDSLPERARKVAGETAEKVDKLASQHISAMRLPDPDSLELDGSAWIGQLPMFLRAFGGVPAAETLRSDWASVLDAHDEASSKHFKKYWDGIRSRDSKSAFAAGLGAMREAFLSRRTADPAFLKNMKAWSDDRELGLSRDDLKAYKRLASDLEDSLKKGRATFESTNKRASL